MTDPTGQDIPLVEYMLTTVDNPFDPFTQFDQWYSFDRFLGHNTPGLLASVCVTADDLSDADQFVALQSAIEEIVRDNVSGVHRKVKRGDLSALNETVS